MTVIIAGERSGVGKTTVTLSLLSSLCRQGVSVQSFKVGPDYIDPMFHQYVTNQPCRNLDAVLTSERYIKKCFKLHSNKSEYALIEGVMGLFDGVGASSLIIDNNSDKINYPVDFASTAHVARLLDVPVILVIDCGRLSGSVAAIAHGYCYLDPRIKIAGLVLNRVGSDRHLSLLKSSLKNLGLPIVGVLKREDNISIPDRHLGLVPTGELTALDRVIDQLAKLGDNCFDWELLLPLLRVNQLKEPKLAGLTEVSMGVNIQQSGYRIRIAVARDKAFNFYYQDNLDLLQELGAELVFWSPTNDDQLPKNIQGMYFGGGFPEVFAQDLAGNIQVMGQVKNIILSGIPTIAECGGLMYLCESIIDFDNQPWPMVGIIPASAKMDKKLTLGYRRAVVLENSFLHHAGKNIYGHEFHRSCLNSETTCPLFNTFRYDCEENMGWEGWNLANVHASYIHQHWGESIEIPQNFLGECVKFLKTRSKM
ncbi:cobyrinate a,c-diamide synthase [Cylindrospermopsis curvispora]|uniref:Cobyrinate a,c-diamide synthase n=1 Tax=Cylindrospermopsis curvispora GIHE-G1 TaxID=2666332 RepID=A0A7H0EXQ2_9CYAN|nr:cobyrinate a,c-diamide synthase [Cylindrospermopsis curvispora]QNP28568.1 cobyrinate a,c-diamide synthase [Cylindrospermopsis curvispora GIHE-G1]